MSARRPVFSGAFRALAASEAWSAVANTASGLLVQQIAVDLLRASSFEVGVLGMAARLPYSVLSPFAGHWADHWPRKRTILLCTALRGALLIGVAVAFAAHAGSFALLAALAFGAAALTVQHDVSFSAFVPDVVPREQLIRGNAWLEALRSVATLLSSTGAGIAMARGWSFAALALCGAAYIMSAAHLRGTPSDAAPVARGANGLISIVRTGARTTIELFRDPRLRSIILLTLYSSFWLSAVSALAFLRLRRELGISDAAIGIIYAVATLGTFLGSLGAAPFGERASIRTVVVVATLLSAASCLILGLTPPAGVRPIVAMLGLGALNASVVIYNVNVVSYRQRLVPREFQGRAVGAIRFVTWGALPLSPLLAGLAASVYGTGFVMRAAAFSLASAAAFVAIPRFFDPAAAGRPMFETPADGADTPAA